MLNFSQQVIAIESRLRCPALSIRVRQKERKGGVTTVKKGFISTAEFIPYIKYPI